MYATAVEINADAAAWGDEMLGGGFGFSGALHTGFTNARDGGGPPTTATIVTSMSDDLLVGVFVPSELRGATRTRDPSEEVGRDAGGEEAEDSDAPTAYLFVVDKRVSGQLGVVSARNATLTLHPAVGRASVAPPGAQGSHGFDELYMKQGVRRPKPGPRRKMHSSVSRRAQGRGSSTHEAAVPLEVTVELVGGGGAMVRLHAAAGASAEAAVIDAAYAMVSWTYEAGAADLMSIKAPEWAYDTWHARYRPYENLELTAGRNFEDGEQTSFIIGGSFAGVSPPTAADEAKAWAWAGLNLMAMSAPNRSDLAAYGPSSAAIGAVLDYGYAFGFFGTVEPAVGSEVLSASQVLAINSAFRCHGRWSGLVVGRNLDGDVSQLDATAAAAAALRRSGRWLLPFASASNASAALALGKRGLAFAMPAVPAYTGAINAAASRSSGGGDVDSAERWAQAVASQYQPMRQMLAASYSPDPLNPGEWLLDAYMPFAASLDACASESDSMLRWSAFSALAYGARGIFWRGAGVCAPLGSPKFSLLASINTRIAQWGNTFVASRPKSDYPGGGYNITKLFATGYRVAGAVAPGSGGASDLVQAADVDVLVAQLGSMGRPATPLIYIVDKRVSEKPGVAAVRTVHVTLHDSVTATQPVEGDCDAAHCQCGLSVVGRVVALRLPGGSGQLVALQLANPA